MNRSCWGNDRENKLQYKTEKSEPTSKSIFVINLPSFYSLAGASVKRSSDVTLNKTEKIFQFLNLIRLLSFILIFYLFYFFFKGERTVLRSLNMLSWTFLSATAWCLNSIQFLLSSDLACLDSGFCKALVMFSLSNGCSFPNVYLYLFIFFFTHYSHEQRSL